MEFPLREGTDTVCTIRLCLRFLTPRLDSILPPNPEPSFDALRPFALIYRLLEAVLLVFLVELVRRESCVFLSFSFSLVVALLFLPSRSRKC